MAKLNKEKENQAVKASKAVKAPKAQKAPKSPKKAKNPGEKGKGGKVILVVVLVLLCAGGVTLGVLSVTKNMFGGRDKVLGFLQSMDPQYQMMTTREETVRVREEELDAREESLLKKEEKLAEQAAQIKADENSVSALEAYIAGLSEEKLEQLKKVGTIYTNMDAKKAADVLPELGSVQDMAVVLYFMKPAASAEVLGAVDAAVAAEITQAMLE